MLTTRLLDIADQSRTLHRVDDAARRLIGSAPKPPGPPRAAEALSTIAFMEDQIAFVEWIQRTYGDVAYIHMGGMPIYVIHDPELIGEVLLKKQASFHKDSFIELLKEILGEGLLTSENPRWRRQRKLAAPALKRKQIASYAESMSRITSEWAASLQDGETVDLWTSMMEVTLEIVVETLFGVRGMEFAKEVSEAMDEAMEFFATEQNSIWYFIPRQVPSPARKRFSRALKKLDEIIYGLIETRRSQPPGDDLLYRLIQARHDDGDAMTLRQLRDEAITMFLAGHETTALVGTFALDLLARNPRTARALAKEVEEVLGDRRPTLEDLNKLEYTRAVIQETMRIQPPAWIIGRRAIEDVQIGEWQIPAGAQIIMSQWVMHRSSEHFEDPLQFKPERWLGGELEASLPRHVYFPFGGGSRICIGNHFAMMEATILLAETVRQVEFELLDHSPMTYDPAITLRPARAVPARVHKL